MFIFGFGAIDPVDTTTLPVDVFVVRDPEYPITPLPDDGGVWIVPLCASTHENIVPLEDSIPDQANDPELVFTTPVATSTVDHVDSFRAPLHVDHVMVTVAPVSVHVDVAFFGRSAIFTIGSTCSSPDDGVTR